MDDTGLEFVGEVNPIYLEKNYDSKKATHHETKCQPRYSPNKFVETFAYPNKYIALVNTMPYLVINQADYVVLRKNMKYAFLSTANFLIKCDSKIKPEYVIHRLYMMYESLIAMSLFLQSNNKTIIWYEDYFNRSGTNTDILDQSRYKNVIYSQIDKFMKNSDIQVVQ